MDRLGSRWRSRSSSQWGTCLITSAYNYFRHPPGVSSPCCCWRAGGSAHLKRLVLSSGQKSPTFWPRAPTNVDAERWCSSLPHFPHGPRQVCLSGSPCPVTKTRTMKLPCRVLLPLRSQHKPSVVMTASSYGQCPAQRDLDLSWDLQRPIWYTQQVLNRSQGSVEGRKALAVWLLPPPGSPAGRNSSSWAPCHRQTLFTSVSLQGWWAEHRGWQLCCALISRGTPPGQKREKKRSWIDLICKLTKAPGILWAWHPLREKNPTQTKHIQEHAIYKTNL